MEKVESGLFVQVAYKGTLEDGQIFDSSQGRQPLEVQIGSGQLIKGFEAALIDMAVSEKKTFTLSPEDAYGPRDENQKRSFPKSEVPPEMNPQAGQTIALSTPDGRQIPATITDVTDEQITLDLNHPLAGKALTFDIEVVGITQAATQAPADCGCDCSSGQPEGGGGCGDGCGSSGCGC